MGLVTVRVYAVDENDDALAGVMVQVYDSVGTFQTQNTTAVVGSDAYAEFTLNGDDPPEDYTIRLSKTGVAFDGLLGTDSQTPQALEIYDPPASSPSGTNDFTVQGQTFTRPASTNPRLCKASGFFKDASGRPRTNLDIRFIPAFDPVVVDGDAVMGYQLDGKTDSDGYFEVELYRTGTYQAVVEALDDIPRDIVVPDASSCNLVHLLFPTVETVEYDPDPVNVTVDNTVTVTLTITTTSGVVLDPCDGDVTFSIDDGEVATYQFANDGTLRVMGRSVGTAVITATRADDTIVVVPETALATLTVNVT